METTWRPVKVEKNPIVIWSGLQQESLVGSREARYTMGMDDEPIETIGIFEIADADDGPQAGVITTFIGPDGEYVDSPHEAVCWVGLVTEGSWAGKWLNCPIDETDEWTHRKLH